MTNNWKEREARVNLEKIAREVDLKQKKQQRYERILERLDVKAILDDIRTGLWKEGEIREVTEKDKKDFVYKTGYELVTKIPSVLVHAEPIYETRYIYGSSLDGGISLGGGNCREFDHMDYEADLGDIEVRVRVVLEEKVHWVSNDSLSGYRLGEPTPVEYQIKETCARVEDIPFMTKEDPWTSYSRRERSWFPLLNDRLRDNHTWFYTKEATSQDLEEIMVERAAKRRDTDNLPFQMRDKTNELIAKMPYEKVTRGVDIMKGFYEWKTEWYYNEK